MLSYETRVKDIFIVAKIYKVQGKDSSNLARFTMPTPVFITVNIYIYIYIYIYITQVKDNKKYLQKNYWNLWLYVLMSCTPFRVNPHSILGWMSRNFLFKTVQVLVGRSPLQYFKLQISRLFRARSSLTFRKL